MWLCCCKCGGDDRSDDGEPNERTRLLAEPSAADLPSCGDPVTRSSGGGAVDAATASARYDDNLLQQMTASVIDVAAVSSQHLDPADRQAREREYAAQMALLPPMPVVLVDATPPSGSDEEQDPDEPPVETPPPWTVRYDQPIVVPLRSRTHPPREFL